MLADAVRQAARAGDWPLAAGMIYDLAIGQLIGPDGSAPWSTSSPACLPAGLDEPQPHLVSAAVAVSAGVTNRALPR